MEQEQLLALFQFFLFLSCLLGFVFLLLVAYPASSLLWCWVGCWLLVVGPELVDVVYATPLDDVDLPFGDLYDGLAQTLREPVGEVAEAGLHPGAYLHGLRGLQLDDLEYSRHRVLDVCEVPGVVRVDEGYLVLARHSTGNSRY